MLEKFLSRSEKFFQNTPKSLARLFTFIAIQSQNRTNLQFLLWFFNFSSQFQPVLDSWHVTKWNLKVYFLLVKDPIGYRNQLKNYKKKD